MVKDLPDWVRKSKTLYNSCIAGAIEEEKYIEGLNKAGLEEVKITERIYYDKTQLKEFLKSEEPSSIKLPSSENLEKSAQSLEGKIWSAKIKARKPGSK